MGILMILLSRYSSPSEGIFIGLMQGLLIAVVLGIIALVRKKKKDGDENPK